MTDPIRLPWADEQRLISAVDVAARYYRETLFADAGAGPRCYLTTRGVEHVLDRDSVWTVGYAPPGWTNLAQHLRSAGYDDEESIAAGLTTRCRRGTVIDHFRDRVVVPIRDHLDGHVIAFTGRTAPRTGADVPKYINTPTTALYRKSDELLGLHEQRFALAGGAQSALVEGAFDVLALAAPSTQEPLAPVSPCGTSLSALQLATLVTRASRREVLIAFDNDPAGLAATVKVHELAAATGVAVTVMALPQGGDPANAVEPRAQSLTVSRSAPRSREQLRTGLPGRPLVKAAAYVHNRR